MLIELLLSLITLTTLVYLIRRIYVHTRENDELMYRVEELEKRVLPEHNKQHQFFKPVAKKKEEQ